MNTGQINWHLWRQSIKNYVVENYEHYREEDRLSTNNARKIEFLTTIKVLDNLITEKKSILDCAAGTGI